MKNKVVLIYPQFPTPLAGVKGFNIPLGLVHLGTYIKSNGFDVKLIDTVVEDNYLSLIEREIKSGPLCVGISAMTAQLPHAIELAKEIKKINKDIPIVLGGIHATIFGQQVLEDDLIDYIVLREGEIPFLKLLQYLASPGEERLDSIKGIGYRNKSGKIELIDNFERFNYAEMPPINYDLLNPIVLDRYIEMDNLYFPVLTARGCPHRCAFCINVILKEFRQYWAWTPERTISEVKRVLQLPRKHVHRITFFDENTFVNKRRIEGIVQLIEKEGLEFEWYCSARANYFREGFLDIPFLQRLNRCGLRRISLGIETGSDKVLTYLQKGISVNQILRAADYCEAADIRPSYSMMIGLPNEDRDDIKQTVVLIKKLSEKHKSWGIVGPQLFRPYPGSNVYDDCVKAGLHECNSTDEWIRIVDENSEILDARKMPWIAYPKMVNVVHFYSVLIAAGFGNLIKIWNEYCRMTKRNILFKFAGLAGLLMLSSVGKTRLLFNYYDLFFEKSLFDKIRRSHLSF